ncbi:hypothetical protein NS365_05515 [Aureimonas ureilytica]|uniref:Uncharacterized protein n=1 Tax=Aureimonas ureilytica TaxID=401562 RepID=A0A175RTX7_9HYPH|nr:hypothetical protein [Aureimonas ureilytica]KTR06893.1 hypothetical protein NS365_05515 [Aureimonas ureilytica]
MKFDLFRSLSDAELDAAIKALVTQITSGATTITSPDAGSVGYMTTREAERLVEKMERSRCSRLGIPFDSGRRIRYTKVYVRQGL